MATRAFRRQATRAAELHRASLEIDDVQAPVARYGPAAQTIRQRPLRRQGFVAHHEVYSGAILSDAGRAVARPDPLAAVAALSGVLYLRPPQPTVVRRLSGH